MSDHTDNSLQQQSEVNQSFTVKVADLRQLRDPSLDTVEYSSQMGADNTASCQTEAV